MSTGEVVIQQIINALSLGSIYALVAIGLAMVFGILRLINFAHGDLMMVGAYSFLFLVSAGLPPWLAMMVTVAIVVVAGLLMERVAYRPVRGAADVTVLLTSFAVSVFLQNAGSLLFTPVSRAFPVPPLLRGALQLGVFQVPRVNALAVVATAVLLVLVTWFVTRTRVGIAMRATSENLLAARLVGIRTNQVIMAAFTVASAFAAVAGVLWGMRAGKIDPLMGFDPILKAFVAVVVGGFGSIPGAVLGSYTLSLSEVIFQGLMPAALSSYRDAFVYIILILFLLWRPQGLLGSTEGEKV